VGPGTDVDACDVGSAGLGVVVDDRDGGVAETDVVVVTVGLGLVVVVTRLAVVGLAGTGVIVTCVAGAGAGRTRRYSTRAAVKMSAVQTVDRRRRPILTSTEARCRLRCRRA
jgi:hypothetical protein